LYKYYMSNQSGYVGGTTSASASESNSTGQGQGFHGVTINGAYDYVHDSSRDPSYAATSPSSSSSKGTLGGASSGVSSLSTPYPRDMTNTWSPAGAGSGTLYGYTTFDLTLAEPTVLNELGTPELADNASVMYTSDAYEHPHSAEVALRQRRKIKVQTYRYYTVVNPQLITHKIIPRVAADLLVLNAGAECHAHPDDSNAETSYKQGGSQFLWYVEKTVIRYGPWEADSLHQTSDPDRGATPGEMDGDIENYPEVSDGGLYIIYDSPLVVESRFGGDVTSGKQDAFIDFI